MSTQINWNANSVRKHLKFHDLELKTFFRNVSHRSQGAIYQKVEAGGGLKFHDRDGVRNGYLEGAMLEVATGKVFPPTFSDVEIIDANISIAAPKPEIYE